MRRIFAIIQARMGSSRLPCKSLLNLRGQPIIDWIIQRLNQSRRLNGLLAAVPDTELDIALQEHLDINNVPWIAGAENDVLGRFIKGIEASGATHVVRVCADNPLISGEAVDRLIEFYENSAVDYAYNHIPKNNLWPDGLGAEMVSADLMFRLNDAAKKPAQREHCFNYIWDNADQFSIGTFDPEEKWLQRPDIKLDIDTPADYSRMAQLAVNPKSRLQEIISTWDLQQNIRPRSIH